MNNFKYLTGPCLVCGRQRTGPAYGITPEQAVCEDCRVDRAEEVEAALNKAQGIEVEVADEAGRGKRKSS